MVVLAGELFGLKVLATTEYRLGDIYLRHHAPDYQADPGIVVVDIDDPSMVAMEKIAGLFPWKREIHADLVQALGQFSPRAIVFDMGFHERDLLKPASDARLSEEIKAFPKAYVQALRLDKNLDKTNGTPLKELVQAFGIRKTGRPDVAAAIQLPYAIEQGAWRLGLANIPDDADGVVRRWPLYIDVNGWHIPSMPARVGHDLGMSLPPGHDFQILWPERGHLRLSYSELYKKLTEEFYILSPAALAQLDALFRNKIIVVGSSAGFAFDHHLTPLAAGYPGVDVLAVGLDNLKNGRSLLITTPIWSFAFGVALIVLLSLMFMQRLNPLLIGSGLALLSFASVYFADSMILQQIMLPLATPLIFAWAWFFSAAFAGYLREKRARDKTVSLFGRFLNPEVVRKMIDHGETVESLSGQTRTITVLFSDIRGFTSLAETRSPGDIVKLLNRYFEHQVEVVWRHGGTLDKFIGDCIMAFWGAPVDDPDQARHAVAAAMEMQENLLMFRKELEADSSDVLDFDVGIGVHTGPAVVGFIGTKRKLDYTAIGDNVNLASRVEGLTKGVARVLVTRETMLACGQSESDVESEFESTFKFESRGAFAVKGRNAEVELYEPMRKSE